MLTVSRFKHFFKDVMAHVNTVNTAVVAVAAGLAALTTKVNGGYTAFTDVANVLTADEINGSATVEYATAATLDIADDLMAAGDWTDVTQTGAGAVTITVSGTATLNGAQAPIAVGTQWSTKRIRCIGANAYTVS